MTVEELNALAAARLDKVGNPPVKDITEEQAAAALREAVVDAYLYRGQRATAEAVEFCAAAVARELKADVQHLGLGWLPLAEVRRAIRIAALAEAEFYPSVSAFYRACAAYVRGEGAEVTARARQLAASRRRGAGALPQPDDDAGRLVAMQRRTLEAMCGGDGKNQKKNGK